MDFFGIMVKMLLGMAGSHNRMPGSVLGSVPNSNFLLIVPWKIVSYGSSG